MRFELFMLWATGQRILWETECCVLLDALRVIKTRYILLLQKGSVFWRRHNGSVPLRPGHVDYIQQFCLDASQTQTRAAHCSTRERLLNDWDVSFSFMREREGEGSQRRKEASSNVWENVTRWLFRFFLIRMDTCSHRALLEFNKRALFDSFYLFIYSFILFYYLYKFLYFFPQCLSF